jgi:hypothetical protein
VRPGPGRAYIEPLIPVVLDRSVQPGKVFDVTVSLDAVPDGYKGMAARDAVNVFVQP